MDDQKKEETVKAQVPPAVTEQKDEKVEEVIDYKAELEASVAREAKVSQERDNYKEGILIAKGKKAGGEVMVVDRKELERLIDERSAHQVEALRQTVVAAPFEVALGQVSQDPDEQALIKHIYETRISHTGNDQASFKNDLEEAQLLANKKTVKRTIEELRVAAQRRPTAGSGAGSSTSQVQSTGDADFTPSQLEYFKAHKLDPEKVRLNLKRLPVSGPVSQQK